MHAIRHKVINLESNMSNKISRAVGVIDHEVGNSIAVVNLLKKIGVEPIVLRQSHDMRRAREAIQHIILPGVGSFDAGIKSLKKTGLFEEISDYVANGGHMLGICLGMHLMFQGSEEGNEDGLGLFVGTVMRMSESVDYRIPHVGWNQIVPTKSHFILNQIKNLRFYHNHSFAVPGGNICEIAKVDHGQPYSVIVGKKRIYGVQFHPEKSHASGRLLIQNFLSSDFDDDNSSKSSSFSDKRMIFE